MKRLGKGASGQVAAFTSPSGEVPPAQKQIVLAFGVRNPAEALDCCKSVFGAAHDSNLQDVVLYSPACKSRITRDC